MRGSGPLGWCSLSRKQKPPEGLALREVVMLINAVVDVVNDPHLKKKENDPGGNVAELRNVIDQILSDGPRH